MSLHVLQRRAQVGQKKTLKIVKRKFHTYNYIYNIYIYVCVCVCVCVFVLFLFFSLIQHASYQSNRVRDVETSNQGSTSQESIHIIINIHAHKISCTYFNNALKLERSRDVTASFCLMDAHRHNYIYANYSFHAWLSDCASLWKKSFVSLSSDFSAEQQPKLRKVGHIVLWIVGLDEGFYGNCAEQSGLEPSWSDLREQYVPCICFETCFQRSFWSDTQDRCRSQTNWPQNIVQFAWTKFLEIITLFLNYIQFIYCQHRLLL